MNSFTMRGRARGSKSISDILCHASFDTKVLKNKQNRNEVKDQQPQQTLF